MARKKSEPTERRASRLALIPPRMTVVSDHALGHEQCGDDCFDLAFKLGPVFDILRHPDTRMPMAIAVYGDWGTGKTSAMEWLHGHLDVWNKEGKDERKIVAKPVWFYPWKYHTREDVWRGLISEVVINSIDVTKATPGTVVNAVKQFGMFLGRSFVHVMASVKLPGIGEVDGKAAEAILEDYRNISHPEKAYLNDFETSLKRWIDDTLGENERMVIFIDDLDRCMPEVALEVLEALKLYLNIDRLIFAVGVDRDVINELVVKHYEQLGLKPDKSANYLAKMFQVQVEVGPHETQIERFLDMQLDSSDIWQSDELTNDQRDMFRRLILRFAARNPREIKRVLNDALMAAAGATMVSEEDQQYTFRQGLQTFFVKKVLEQPKYSRGSLIGSDLGDRFFGAWSGIVRVTGGKPEAETVVVPKAFIEQQQRKHDAHRLPGQDTDAEGSDENPRIEPSSFTKWEEYWGLLRDDTFADLLHLLADPDLGEMMEIGWPSSTRLIGAAMGSSSDIGIVREVIARELGVKPEELTDKHYAGTTKLSLVGAEMSDLSPLMSLTGLQELDLRGTQVSDLSPLMHLTGLQRLNLGGTQVSDVEPLKDLTGLRELDLWGTQVSDLSPLMNLTGLRKLDLRGTQVSDLLPLMNLTGLQELYLQGTQVSDVEPLMSLTGLQELYLQGTQVADLSPLMNLTGLQWLDVQQTQVTGGQAEELQEVLPNVVLVAQ